MTNPLTSTPPVFTAHPVDITALPDGKWYASCSCGWVDEEDSDTAGLAIARAKQVHGHEGA